MKHARYLVTIKDGLPQSEIDRALSTIAQCKAVYSCRPIEKETDRPANHPDLFDNNQKR